MIKVMIADDQELIRQSLQIVLEMKEGIEVTATAKDGREVIQEVRKDKPDVILMDVMMPVMDGLEAARYIRRSNKENARDIPIIAMTANAFTEDRRRVLEAGMNEHLAKPLESEVLIEMIAKYCGK